MHVCMYVCVCVCMHVFTKLCGSQVEESYKATIEVFIIIYNNNDNNNSFL